MIILEHLIVDRLLILLLFLSMFCMTQTAKGQNPSEDCPSPNLLHSSGQCFQLNTPSGFRHRHFGAWLD